MDSMEKMDNIPHWWNNYGWYSWMFIPIWGINIQLWNVEEHVPNVMNISKNMFQSLVLSVQHVPKSTIWFEMNSHKTWTKVRSKKRTRVFLKNQEQHFWKTIRSGALAPAPAARAKDSVIPQIPAEVGRYCDILWYIHYIFNVYIIYI